MAKKKRKKKKDRRSFAVTLTAAAATAAIGLVILVLFSDVFFKKEPPVPTPSPPAAEREVDLYFGSPEGTYLATERVRINEDGIEDKLRESLEALARGPRTGLTPTIPPGTRILGVKLDGATAVVDLSEEVVSNHAGGSSGEIQTVYSIVNTLTLNFREVRSVRILVDGSPRETLVGHIDLTVPLAPDKGLIRTPKTVES